MGIIIIIIILSCYNNNNKLSEEDLNHSDHNITEIGWETLKSPSDLKRLAVTLTSVKNHQLTRMWKNSPGIMIIINVKKVKLVTVVGKVPVEMNTASRVIIILSCLQHGYPWSSLATPPYRSSLLAGPQGYIPYPHRAAVCKFEQVVLTLLGHVWGSMGEHHLWAHPCFSSCVLHVWFV